MTGIDRSPPLTSVSLSVLLGMLATLGAGVGALSAFAVGLLGVALLALGGLRGIRAAVTAGGGALFGATLLAGVSGAGVEPLLLALLGTVAAWDVGEHGIGVGQQLGRQADTRRVVFVHAGGSLLVGTVAAAVAYAAYRTATGGQPMAALVLLLLGAIALVSALRE